MEPVSVDLILSPNASPQVLVRSFGEHQDSPFNIGLGIAMAYNHRGHGILNCNTGDDLDLIQP